jgi:hypothetical protein
MEQFYEFETEIEENVDSPMIEYMDIRSIKENDSLLSKKKRLVDLIKGLNRFELSEIFHIFKIAKCSYTENANGIFINITNVCEEVIHKVYDFLEYIKEKEKELNIHEDYMKIEKEKIKHVNKLNEESYDNYIFNKNFVNQIQEQKNIEVLSESDEDIIYQLDLSSDEDQDLENKLSLKKKKIKYTGTKAKIIKSYKETKDSSSYIKKKGSKDKENETEAI